MEKTNELKVAIAHDYLYEFGGAEQVLWELLKIFPEADLYTSIYVPTEKQRAFWAEIDKHRTYTPKWGKLKLPKLLYKCLIPLQIRFFKRQNLDNYELVISSSASFAKYVRTAEGTKHISYIHTPPRFIWGYDTSTYHKIPKLLKKLSAPLINRLKRLDKESVSSIDKIFTNSKNIQAKIKKIYNRSSEVIYPPVQISEIKNQHSTQKKDFFMTIGRLYPYKKIDIIVDAFKGLGEKLIVIGDGPEKEKLKQRSEDNIEFKGFVDEEVKISLLNEAKGFIFAAEEDFGIVMVEALAAGTPVIAYKKGGSLEIIKDKKNGIFFTEQTPEAIRKSIKEFNTLDFITTEVAKTSTPYTPKYFQEKIEQEVRTMFRDTEA